MFKPSDILIYVSHYAIPYVPTPMDVAREMLKVAGVRPEEVVVDAGAGECNIVVAAAELGAIGVGVEKDPLLVKKCSLRIRKLGLKNAYIVWGDMFEFDYSIADVVTTYLLPEANRLIARKIAESARRITRLVSHDFEVPGLNCVECVDLRGPLRTHKIFLYLIKPSRAPSLYSP